MDMATCRCYLNRPQNGQKVHYNERQESYEGRCQGGDWTLLTIHIQGDRYLVVLLAGMLLLAYLGCGNDKEKRAEGTSESTTTDADESSMEKEIIGKDGASMVLIPAGEFMMGDHHGDGWNHERPVHAVYLDAFYIDKYEVTNAQYSQFLNEYGEMTDPVGHILINIDNDWCKIIRGGNAYKPVAGYERHPVVNVSWYGAAAYAQHYGKRLPTEAEWERAARGTFVGEGEYRKYVWGDEWPPPKGGGNFYDEDIDGYDDAYGAPPES